MAVNSYETMLVFSVANGEENVQALTEKFKALVEEHAGGIALDQIAHGLREQRGPRLGFLVELVVGHGMPWAQEMGAGAGAASTVVMMLVPILVFVISQSNIIETMSSSGMKD